MPVEDFYGLVGPGSLSGFFIHRRELCGMETADRVATATDVVLALILKTLAGTNLQFL